MKPGPIVVLSANPQAPSFRYRLAPAIAELQARGWPVKVQTLPRRRYGWRLLTRWQLLRGSAVVVLHKLRLQPWEVRWLKAWQPALVLDIDDAIWLRQPSVVGQAAAAPRQRAAAFDAVCAAATLTLAGNQVLAERARQAGGRVQLLPTPVDARAYRPTREQRPPGGTLVWVGLPGNLVYLEPLRPVFARLQERHPGLRLRIISSAWPDWPEVDIERVAWSSVREKVDIASADIGLMPLSDDAYARGKCAFKLLQYMAAGLPCVGSPVGANCEVVLDGRTGLLADTPEQWERAIEHLLAHPDEAARMGRAGRQHALQGYDMQVLAAQAADLVEAVTLQCGAPRVEGTRRTLA